MLEDCSPSPVRDAGFTPPWSSDYFLNLAEQLHSSSEPFDAAVQGTPARQTQNLTEVMRNAYDWRRDNNSGNLVRFIGFISWSRIINTYEEEIGSQNPFMDLDTLRGHVKTACETTASDSSPATSYMEHTLSLLLAIVAVLEDPDISQLANSFTEKSRQHATAKAQEEAVDEHTIRLLMLVVSRSRLVIINNTCLYSFIQG